MDGFKILEWIRIKILWDLKNHFWKRTIEKNGIRLKKVPKKWFRFHIRFIKIHMDLIMNSGESPPKMVPSNNADQIPFLSYTRSTSVCHSIRTLKNAANTAEILPAFCVCRRCSLPPLLSISLKLFALPLPPLSHIPALSFAHFFTQNSLVVAIVCFWLLLLAYHRRFG